MKTRKETTCPYCGRRFGIAEGTEGQVIKILQDTGPLRFTNRMEKSGLTGKVLSEALKRLEDKKLVERKMRPDPQGIRAYVILISLKKRR